MQVGVTAMEVQIKCLDLNEKGTVNTAEDLRRLFPQFKTYSVEKARSFYYFETSIRNM